jgi:hypothetical protein
MKYLAAKLTRLGLFFKRADGLSAERPSRQKLALICLLIFFIAAGVRLLQWQNNRLTIDHTMWRLTERYQEEAQLLLNGEFAAFVRGSTTEPDPGILMHTPGYPLLIAVIYRISGNSDTAVRLFQILIDAGAALLLFLMTVELLPSAVAIIAGLLAAFSPQLAYSSLLLLPDSLSGFPILLAIYLIIRASKRPRILTVMVAGAAIGLSCWLRANALLLAPFLCLLMFVLFERARRWRYAAALGGAALLVIAPITIRNAIVFRSFIPLSLGAGQNLVAGIADYDPEKRFGFEAYDDAACRQEAELYNRPDYAADLYRPDGIQRERARIGRVVAVIRSNKLWFLGIMLRRATLMLAYEQVPIVSVEPSVTNSLEVTNETELAWASSPAELIAGHAFSGPAQLSLMENNQALRIMGDDSSDGKQFTSALIDVKRKSDYLLRLPVRIEQGRMVIRVENGQTGATLASATIPDSLEPDAPMKDSLTVIQLPFVNTGADQVRIVLANAQAQPTPSLIHIGGLEMFRLGAASYLWTRYPRALVKIVQKFFKTNWMLPLMLSGIVFLSLARRGRVLAIALVVPAYYLCVHSPLHIEPRYVLVMHYFFSILIATALYWCGKRLVEVAQRLMAFKLQGKARSS